MSKVHGWIHIAIMGSYREVLDDLIGRIERSGILEDTTAVYACVAGPETDYPFPSWLTVVDRRDDLSLAECPTLDKLWSWSRTVEPGSKVWYIHTKGASKLNSHFDTSWRHYMTDYIIDRWRDCAAALDDHELCGVEWVTPETPGFEAAWGFPVPSGCRAYMGNFWWARCDYLSSLPVMQVNLWLDRFAAEWTFVGVGRPRVKELHHKGVNLYLAE